MLLKRKGASCYFCAVGLGSHVEKDITPYFDSRLNEAAPIVQEKLAQICYSDGKRKYIKGNAESHFARNNGIAENLCADLLTERGRTMPELNYEIQQKIACLSEEKNGWTKEINLVSWNNNKAKYDIRAWSADHTKMGRGITLSKEELIVLKTVLNELLCGHGE